MNVGMIDFLNNREVKDDDDEKSSPQKFCDDKYVRT